jgi:ribonuclease HI
MSYIQATGALRTTPSDLLFAHADMAPMKWLVKLQCQRAALRLATLGESHPLYLTINKAAGSYPRRHVSPLHDILHISKISPFSVETVDCRPRHPGWEPPFQIEIAPSKEDAITADQNCAADVKIYVDGSGKDGKVGAAAVLYFGFRTPRTARFHLGSTTQHTVYEGECVGQLLGLRLLRDSGINLNRSAISIGVDNQAAIKRHVNRARGPASYITEEVHKLTSLLVSRYPGATFTVRWTPGHSGLTGNEAADTEAKKAADSPTFNSRSRFGILAKPLPISRSAHRHRLTELVNRAYHRSFHSNPRAQRIGRFDRSMPSNRYRRATASMPKRLASILMQLRTNHVPLQAYLHRFKIANSSTCLQCNLHPETVTHFLMHCSKYTVERNQLKRDLKSGKRLDLSILGDEENFPALFKFINATKRFADTFGDLSPANPPPTPRQP